MFIWYSWAIVCKYIGGIDIAVVIVIDIVIVITPFNLVMEFTFPSPYLSELIFERSLVDAVIRILNLAWFRSCKYMVGYNEGLTHSTAMAWQNLFDI